MSSLFMNCVDVGELKSFAVFSDVHLRIPQSEMQSLFFESVHHAARNHDSIIFLGDIFDFIFARQGFFAEYWRSFFDLCREISDKGCRVYFVEGNHDFGFCRATLDHLKCFKRLTSKGVFARHPKIGNLVFKHGDDIVCRWHYLLFRGFVKSAFLERCAAWFSGRWLNDVFMNYAKVSRNYGEAVRPLEAQFFYDQVQRFLLNAQKKCPVNMLFLGHVHAWIGCVFPSQNPDSRAGTAVFVGPDWPSCPQYLSVCEQGNVTRIFCAKILAEKFDIPAAQPLPPTLNQVAYL